ncbi:MAG: glucose dehydrogenase, partial [Chloroflexota bacterium]
MGRLIVPIVLAALVGSSTAPLPPIPADLGIQLVQDGFDRPVFLTQAGDSRLFVVEQPGRIKVVGGGTFLDIEANVACCGEQGL